MPTTIPAPALPPTATVGRDVPSGRLLSLDVFRGATIAAMILVNNPGTWSAIYPPLAHAHWHGWTPTDLIFPFFLFIVGVAIAFAFEKRLLRGAPKGDLAFKAGKRALILFGLGLFMAAYPFFTFSPGFALRPGLESLRIMGVLQRIALCYLAVSLLYLYTSQTARHWTAAGLLLFYWGLMTLVPVPGYGAGRLDLPVGTLSAYLDRLLLGTHLWVGTDRQWDPEGLLSTLPAIATTLFGAWTGRLLISDRDGVEKAAVLFARGVVFVALGYVWNWFFPINKGIWTSSYAVFTAGQAMCALALCYWVADVQGKRSWTKPFVIYGVNAITVFVLSGLLARTLGLIQVADGAGGSVSLQGWIFRNIFLAVAYPTLASLLYALTWVAGWFVVLYVMYRRNIIVKV